MIIIIAMLVFFILITLIFFLKGRKSLEAENKALKKVQSTMSNSLRLKGIEVDRLLKKIKKSEEAK